MKIKFLTISLAGIIALGFTFQAEAASKEDATASPSPVATSTAPARPIPFNGKIFSIDKVAKTFSTQNKEKKIRTFEITTETKITRNNKPANFEDLKDGEEIRGSAMKKGDGRFDVLSVNIGPRPDPAKGAPSASPANSPTGRKTKSSSASQSQ